MVHHAGHAKLRRQKAQAGCEARAAQASCAHPQAGANAYTSCRRSGTHLDRCQQEHGAIQGEGSAVLAFAMARQVSRARWADIRALQVVAPVLVHENLLDTRDEGGDDEAKALIPRPSPGPIRASSLVPYCCSAAWSRRSRVPTTKLTICRRRYTDASGRSRTFASGRCRVGR